MYICVWTNLISFVLAVVFECGVRDLATNFLMQVVSVGHILIWDWGIFL